VSRLAIAVTLLVACGSSAPPPPAPAPAAPAAPTGPSAAELAAEHDRAEHAQLAAAHQKLEAEQQDALAVTCAEVGPPSHDRCLPSCYPTEPADSRAAHKLAGAVEIEHYTCKTADGNFVDADDLAKQLGARVFRKRFPRAHKKGSWQEEFETALAAKLPHGDVVVVLGERRDVTHPVTHEKLVCAKVARYARSPRHPNDRCGGIGDVTCEAAGNPTARAINVVHYRLAEARSLQKLANTAGCQQASLEAIAVSRGLPRWRQYAKLNVNRWTDNLLYRTRFDGTLDEDTLFATVGKLGGDAEAVYASCGGGTATTAAEQEQSFHACW
jgi:hypothetical protein